MRLYRKPSGARDCRLIAAPWLNSGEAAEGLLVALLAAVQEPLCKTAHGCIMMLAQPEINLFVLVIVEESRKFTGVAPAEAGTDPCRHLR